jgi:hypothetical protein
MTGQAKRHHVVSEFYLRHFANSQGQLTVVRRDKPPYLTSTTNVGVVSKFNTITDEDGNPSLMVEEMFQQIEAQAAPIFRELQRTDVIPTGDDREWLAMYIALAQTRTPHFRRQAELQEEIFGKANLYTHTDASIREVLREANHREPSDEEVQQAREGIDRIDEYRIEIPSNQTLKSAIDVATGGLAPALLGMHWHLMRSDVLAFICGDHPLAYMREERPENAHLGIGLTSADYSFFSVDPYRSLVFSRARPRTTRPIAATPSMVAEVNELMARYCYEWVAYHPQLRDPLRGFTMSAERPLFHVNSVPVYADRRGVDEALGILRGMIGAIKSAHMPDVT